MKIEQLLVQQLYNNKVVSLQGIGTFRLSDGLVLPAENDKDFQLPADAISFAYDTKTQEDEALVDFIVHQTRKIKPLAAADLDSYLMLSKQFLNIGKPFRIEGIGTLLKNQSGSYDFTPGQYISPKIEAAAKPLKEKLETEPMFGNTKTEKNRGGSGKKVILGIAGLLITGFAAWGTWYLLTKNKQSQDVTTTKDKPVADTNTIHTAQQPGTADTGLAPVSKRPDSLPAAATAQPADRDYTFKVVFLQTKDKLAATKKMNSLVNRGHKIEMSTIDSVNYILAEKFTLPLADTAHVKDSVTKFYYPGSKTYIQLQ